MGRVTAIIGGAAIMALVVLAVLLAFTRADLHIAASDNAVLRSDNNLQGKVIAAQAFNFNRFNQVAELNGRHNSLIDARSERTVIEYREILHREKNCDLPVPADIAGGLLDYANSLRTSAMYTDPSVANTTDANTHAPGEMTYCQAVMWIEPLLATIDKANRNFASIREIENIRSSQ